MSETIRGLESAKEAYQLEHISLVEAVVRGCSSLWDNFAYTNAIRALRAVAKTDNLVQWETEHNRDDGVKLFNGAIRHVRSEEYTNVPSPIESLFLGIFILLFLTGLWFLVFG